jgi:hypothetical protein
MGFDFDQPTNHDISIIRFQSPLIPMSGIEVVRDAELMAGQSTRGILREKAFDVEGLLFSRTTVNGAVVSDWHHHGERHLYGFLSQDGYGWSLDSEGRRPSS